MRTVKEVMAADALFEMANVTPAETGLPFGIYLSHRGRDQGRAQHGPRVKAYPEGFDVARSEIVITVEEEPRVMRVPRKPRIAARDLAQLVAFVRQNREVLLRYWEDNDMGTRELLDALRPVGG